MNKRAFAAAEIQSAHFCPTPAFAAERPAKRGRKAEGLRFESRAQEYLCGKSELYLPGPWIMFVADGKMNWCQPDGLHFDLRRGIITIIEIKYAHCAEAYRQLRHVYAPVLQHIFPAKLWRFQCVEVCKWFDPAVAFPEPISMCARPFEHESRNIGVHIWKS